jgi:glycosyltransferase involved in cell wall biosynthesis
MDKKIKMLVIPSDHTGVGKFRSVDPHVYIAKNYSDEFDVDISYSMPNGDLEAFLKQYDLIHIHKQLDKNCQIMDMIKFLGIPVIIDIDDHFKLGEDHPMSLTAKKERWHEPIINHLKKADYVTTTTPIFADVLKKYNKNVAVFPNAIDPNESQFAVPKIEGNGRLRVGIICGSSHLKDLQLIDGIAKQVDKDKVQFVLCGFDTRGNRTIYNQQTGEKTTRPILPQESVWCDYEKIFTDNYKNISPEHKEFLMKFITYTDDPFANESYRRMWTRDINNYATHYQNVDVLICPLKENEFNSVKSQLKFIECGFTNTAIIAQGFGPYMIDAIPMINRGGEINEDGNCLIVETRKNHKDWAKYINKLANDREMLKKLQDNLSKYIRERYSLEEVCKQRVELYRQLARK